MSVEDDLEPDDEQTAPPSRGSFGQTPAPVRVLVLAAAALALLMLGAAVGLLVKLPGSGDTSGPAADSVDVGFAQDMSAHHNQAVQMANWERDHTTDPELRQLAFDIEQTQLEQLGRMKGWLMLWGQPEDNPSGLHMAWMTAPGGQMAGMNGTSMAAGTGMRVMPGMASADDLRKLRSLTGKALDVEFLQLMLRHHEGGTAMAQYAVDHAQLTAVRTLAQNMLGSQGAEMTQMRQLLASRGAQPLPPPS